MRICKERRENEVYDLFINKREEKRNRRIKKLLNMTNEDLNVLIFENELEIQRLKEKISSIHSYIYGKYCESRIVELEWENEAIKLIIKLIIDNE